MKIKLLSIAVITALFASSNYSHAQAPVLGTAKNFALFSTNGDVSNTGNSHFTGNIGTQNGSSTAFGNVDGVMHDQDLASAAAAADLLIAYNQLDASTPTMFPAPSLGGGQTLFPGIYSINAVTTLDGTLTLDAQNNPDAVFIIQIEAAFSSTANSQVVLANDAQACNVFWKVEGLVDLATNTTLKGTVVANNAAIILNTGANLEGRALSTTGAVTTHGATVRIPLGCGTPELTGPAAPALLSVACYTIFSGNGEVTNTDITFVTGDVGTNVGVTTGFQASNVDGTIHPNPDVSTAQCAQDLGLVYQYLNTLPVDIQLLYPATLGNDLVLTPHTYLLSGLTALTDTITLNAQGNPDAVFVLKIDGAFSTSTYANVELINGAQAKNVFWKVDGATSINDHSVFKGTVVGNNGAVHLGNAVNLEGRALTTSGAVSTVGVTATMTQGCGDPLATNDVAEVKAVTFYPNPFTTSLSVNVGTPGNHELVLYTATGAVILQKTIAEGDTTLQVNFAAGIYFYKLTSSTGISTTGKLISTY